MTTERSPAALWLEWNALQDEWVDLELRVRPIDNEMWDAAVVFDGHVLMWEAHVRDLPPKKRDIGARLL